MENKAKRPLSVWIAQILLVIFVLVFALGFLLIFLKMGTSLVLLVLAIIYLAFIALFCIAFWGMTNRKSFGRWLGVGLLSFMLVFSIASQFLAPSGPIQRYEYSNSTEKIAAIMTQVSLGCLFLALILRLAFAKKVTAFFSQTMESSDVDFLPPPPPSFDT